jgi:hypothetical protein
MEGFRGFECYDDAKLLELHEAYKKQYREISGRLRAYGNSERETCEHLAVTRVNHDAVKRVLRSRGTAFIEGTERTPHPIAGIL